MATAIKRGRRYEIRAQNGRKPNGEIDIRYRSWIPAPNMTKKQIERELERQKVMLEEEVKSGNCADGTTKFRDLTVMCMKELKQQLSPKTYARYTGYLKRINQAIGEGKLKDIRPHHLNAFYRNLAEDGMNHYAKERDSDGNLYHGGLSPKTILEHHRVISKMLNMAVKWGMVEINVASRADPPKVPKREVEYLDEKEITRLLLLLNNEPMQYRTAIRLLLYTGMRRGELCGLEWKDIDFDDKRLRIARSSQYIGKNQLITKEPKTLAGRRTIAISDTICAILREYKVWQNTQRLKLGDKWVDNDRLFTQWNGEPIHPDTFTQWFGKFIKKHGFPHVTLHSLRHSNATLMIAEGVDICTVSKRLGHANTSITLNVYAHALKSKDTDAAEKLDNILSSCVP